MTGRPQYYRLEGRETVSCEMMEWAEGFGPADTRRVAHTTLPNGTRVSTVFLGLDHNYFGDGPPLIFETMAFPPEGYDDLLCERCSTWEEAEVQHVRAVMEAWFTLGPLLLTYEPSLPHD